LNYEETEKILKLEIELEKLKNNKSDNKNQSIEDIKKYNTKFINMKSYDNIAGTIALFPLILSIIFELDISLNFNIIFGVIVFSFYFILIRPSILKNIYK